MPGDFSGEVLPPHARANVVPVHSKEFCAWEKCPFRAHRHRDYRAEAALEADIARRLTA